MGDDVIDSLKAIGVEQKHDLALTSVLFENDDPEEEAREQERMLRDKAEGFDDKDPDDKEICFDEFVETIVRLRPSKTASVMDVAELRYRVRADIKKSTDEGKRLLDIVVSKQRHMENTIQDMHDRVKN